jgi:HK97 family phage major capsid protein
VLRPRSVAAIVPVSIELLEDAPNAGQIITNALTAALGLALDKACLVGVSVAEILGVRNYPGVNSTASFGTPADYTKVSAAIGSILSSNYAGEISGLSWIANPREGAKYDSLATGISSDKTPLPRTPWVSQLQTRYTTSLPITEGAGAESSMILGSFSEMIIGMRTRGVTIEVLPAGTATDAAGTTWNAASQMMRWVRAYLRVDMGLMHPAFFNVMTGVAA